MSGNLAAFSIWNGYAPSIETGPRTIAIDLRFDSASEQSINLFEENTSGALEYVQTLYIDNADNAAPLEIFIPVTQQRIIVPANSFMIVPAFAPDQTMLRVKTATASGLLVRIHVLNVPLPFAMWSV